MIYNTTIYNILQSELIRLGKNEFFNDNQISLFKDEHTFIKKVLSYDDDVKYITNKKFFIGLTLDNEKADDRFKRQFINRFLHFQPCNQTLEIFASNVSYTFLNNIDFLNMYYENIDDFIKGKTITDVKGNETSKSDNRTLQSTLPQHQINLNVDDTELNYGDNNTINRNRTENKRGNTSESSNLNIDTLEKSRKLLEGVFNDFEKNCFMKVY